MYGDVFRRIVVEEAQYMKDGEEALPPFGDSNSDYEMVYTHTHTLTHTHTHSHIHAHTHTHIHTERECIHSIYYIHRWCMCFTHTGKVSRLISRMPGRINTTFATPQTDGYRDSWRRKTRK